MNPNTRNLLVALAVIVLAVVAYAVLTMPDNRTASQKIGDAANAFSNSPTQAARELESRTPGQKIGDAIKDNTGAR